MFFFTSEFTNGHRECKIFDFISSQMSMHCDIFSQKASIEKHFDEDAGKKRPHVETRSAGQPPKFLLDKGDHFFTTKNRCHKPPSQFSIFSDHIPQFAPIRPSIQLQSQSKE